MKMLGMIDTELKAMFEIFRAVGIYWAWVELKFEESRDSTLHIIHLTFLYSFLYPSKLSSIVSSIAIAAFKDWKDLFSSQATNLFTAFCKCQQTWLIFLPLPPLFSSLFTLPLSFSSAFSFLILLQRIANRLHIVFRFWCSLKCNELVTWRPVGMRRSPLRGDHRRL